MTKEKGRILPIGRTWSRQEKIVVTTHGMKEVEAGIILLGIDKHSVIADKVLSYFECLSSSLKYILLISGLL